MNLIKIINDVINEIITESEDNDITRKLLKYQFDDEKELSKKIDLFPIEYKESEAVT